MADEIVQGLSGTEIKDDLLDHILRKLNYSCDLRDSDRYRSYSATAEIHLKLYDSSIVSLDMNIEVPLKVELPKEVVENPVEVKESVVVDEEPNLNIVRGRIKDAKMEVPPEPSEEDGTNTPTRTKRKYTRRSIIDAMAATMEDSGGNVAVGGSVDVV
jgi:hypothetical protein